MTGAGGMALHEESEHDEAPTHGRGGTLVDGVYVRVCLQVEASGLDGEHFESSSILTPMWHRSRSLKLRVYAICVLVYLLASNKLRICRVLFVSHSL